MGWWIVLGVSALVYEILILSFNAHDSDETLGLCFFGLLALLPVGAILGGKLIGGFGWVMNGVLIGVITGLIIIGKAISNGFGIKPFAALLPFFVFGGAVLVFRYLGKHWWSTVLGVVAGGIPIYLLNIPLFIKAKAKKDEILKEKQLEDKSQDSQAALQNAGNEDDEEENIEDGLIKCENCGTVITIEPDSIEHDTTYICPSCEELSKEIKFKYNFAPWLIIFVAIFAIISVQNKSPYHTNSG